MKSLAHDIRQKGQSWKAKDANASKQEEDEAFERMTKFLSLVEWHFSACCAFQLYGTSAGRMNDAVCVSQHVRVCLCVSIELLQY